MIYRHWSGRRKAAFWLALTGVVAAVCLVAATRGPSSSSASPPASVWTGAIGSSHSQGDAAPGAAGPASSEATASSTTSTTALASTPTGGAGTTLSAPRKTLVATLQKDVPGSPSPGAAPTQVVPGSWYGYPSILPVIAKQPGWLQVRLAQRPNESTAWIPTSDAALSIDHFAIVVDLTTTRLYVFDHGREVVDFAAGIGTPATPTPPGNFFVTMTVPGPSPGYGPFVLVTSGHSNAITDWENSGDAIIAIHGPIDAAADARIGSTGAAVSDGCVRLHDSDLAQLAQIPAGTPVDIVSG